MKDIKAILAEHEIDEATAKAIEKAVGENYRTKVETDAKAERIKALEEQNKALTEQVGQLEGDGDQLEALRKQVADYEQAEKERKAKAEEDAKRESFRALFDAALGNREFANDLMRETVFERAYSECQSVGTGAKEAIEAVTKDVDGVWRNPQHDPARMPGVNGLSSKHKADDKRDEATLANFLFGKK